MPAGIEACRRDLRRVWCSSSWALVVMSARAHLHCVLTTPACLCWWTSAFIPVAQPWRRA